ncbi:MAG TPA: preprotein translocase subunit YajC [Thermodesulfobacteriota bacterium]|nr:preprotein translocase subunit YajC [Thermodesulfobacteriota bacterium]
MLNFTTIAFAADEAQAAGGMGQFLSFAPLVILFVIFYFLLIRPQQKKAKEHRGMISKLEKGDMVITSGGIHGAITGVTEDTVTVEIAENVKVKVGKEYIASKKNK